MTTRSSNLAQAHQSGESGQAAVVVALLLFFVFLAVASLAIDGAITYLGRRDLQNVADSAALAACTDLANNGTPSSATITATRIIAANLGASVVYTPNIGAGVGLVQGLEISQPDVRVALRRMVPTVLTQFLGRGQSQIDAKAHCNNSAGGGVLPIAVRHFDSNSGLDLIANCAANGKNSNCASNPTVPYPTDSVKVTVPNGHYGPFDVMIPTAQYTASPTNPGTDVSILDNGAKANNDNSFRGFVLLDIRNVASGNLEFYNGVNGNAQSYKSTSSGWFMQHGYPGPIPDPGSQVAVLNGNSGGFTGKTMIDAGYNVGDIVPIIVYNGYTWGTPDYAVSFTPQISITSGYPNSLATAASYSVGIANSPASSTWQAPLNVYLTFSFSDAASLPPSTHVIMIDGASSTDLMLQGLTYTKTNVAQATPWNGTLKIYSDLAGPTPPTQTVQYLSGLNLTVHSSLGIIHSKSTNFGFTTGSISNDYALRAGDDSMSAVVQQGSSVDLDFVTFGVNSVPPTGCPNLSPTATVFDAGGTPQTWSSLFSPPSLTKVSVQKNKDSVTSPTFTVAPLSGAMTGDYTLRFTVPASNCGPAHSLDIPLTIMPAGTSPGNLQFVVVEGYSLFKITHMQNNELDFGK